MPVLHTFVSAKPPVADPTIVGSVEWNAAHSINIVNADVDPAAGILESKLLLNYPTHALVTLGTANGLSIVGQVLSLGLASSGVAGALSGGDWNTFNGKQDALGFTPVDIASVAWIDLTDGGATTLHTHAAPAGMGDVVGPASAVDNNLAAFNLATGKLIKDSGVLTADVSSAVSLKHAAVTLDVNADTLLSLSTQALGLDTQTANRVFAGPTTGAAAVPTFRALVAADIPALNYQAPLSFPLAASLGGTGVNNGSFNLTIPATGTAALLATANVFTAVQQITVATTSAKALILKTSDNNTTNNLLELQNSAGGLIAAISATGKIGTGAAPSEGIGVNQLITTASTTALIGLSFIARRGAGSTVGYVIGFSGNGEIVATAGGAAAGGIVYGGSVGVKVAGSGANTATATLVIGFDIEPPALTAPIAITGNVVRGLYIRNQGNALLTTSYGMEIAAQSGSATNYALYTNTGLNRFGDQVVIAGTQDLNQLKVTGFTTQTLSPVYFVDNVADTNSIRNILQLEAQSTSTVAVGKGSALLFSLETATNGTFQNAGRVYAQFPADVATSATNATRQMDLVGTAFDAAGEREGWRVRADGTRSLVGIGGQVPTARLHLPIGSTAANTAPLKFTQDATSLLTAVEAGAMEYWQNSLWFTNLAVRRTVVQAQSVAIADLSVSNTTVETTIFTQAHGANYLKVGKHEDIWLQGLINTASGAGDTGTVRVKYAGNTIGTFTIPKSIGGKNVEIHVTITCRAIGAGTTSIQVHANCDIDGSASDPIYNGLSTGLDSTTAQATTVTIQWATASASDNYTQHQARALSIDNNA
jgi:hypothetical protein